ncbi:universal stress protein [Arthrobacter sp. Br18]|uniref:universal stress protein n=1 Tax=Arthrobacter sp. Br18 TaxID=1312954 RepID=UPI0004B9C512|nr:universal stress protein [Arthrobacter sp. Br18]
MDTTPEGPRIVVGVDGSEPSILALRLAAQLAPALEARVHAVSCWDFPPLFAGYLPPDFYTFEGKATKILHEALEKAFGAEPPPGMTTALERGPAPATLVKAGADAQMLIVGRRGHGGIRGMHLGSVSTACVAHAPCPVLVVHEETKPKPPRRPRPKRQAELYVH